MTTARFRIGIDVGGTFTDFVLVEMGNWNLQFHKEPSVSNDPSAAVKKGLQALVKHYGVSAESVELIVHGTTIGLNTIIQRRGARMALLVSNGNKDVLEIARLRLPSSYDFTESAEQPLVPRNLIYEISARMTSSGAIDTPINPDEIKAIGEQLRLEKVEAVAVMLLNSHCNPELEISVANLLREELDGVLISESSLIWPEIREYERCLIAGINSYIHPLMENYFDKLEERVEKNGFEAPLYITANNGGTLSIGTARTRPIDTVLSGPASGVVASTRIGKAAEQNQLITFDMGGTSTDIAICQNGKPEYTSTTFVGDFPLMMPVVNVTAIGAGGGSILWMDAQGFLKIGPKSAGADPGPVCYGRGGISPTITDCYLVLGIIDPERFLDGRMPLDKVAAQNALKILADQLKYTGDDRAEKVAEAAIRVATAKMSTEITKLLAQAGIDPRTYSLLAYGGAGPTHVNFLAEEAQLTSVLIPTAPGTFCALGAVYADVRRDYVRSVKLHIGEKVLGSSDQEGWSTVTAILDNLEQEARTWLAAEGELIGECDFAISFNLRYPSQAYELEILIAPERRKELSASMVCQLFHEEHHRLYGFSELDSMLQTSTIRLGVIGRVGSAQLPEVSGGECVVQGKRDVWYDANYIEADVYKRADVAFGVSIKGPAIFEQPDTTTFLLPGWSAQADRYGTLHLKRDINQ